MPASGDLGMLQPGNGRAARLLCLLHLCSGKARRWYLCGCLEVQDSYVDGTVEQQLCVNCTLHTTL